MNGNRQEIKKTGVLVTMALLFLLFASSSISLISFAFSNGVSSENVSSSTLSTSSSSCGITVSHENPKNDAIQLALNAAAEEQNLIDYSLCWFGNFS